jgi:hypothetical protein
MEKFEKIAQKISEIMPSNYKTEILSKAQSPADIDHDEDFWNEYKEACVEAYEEVTGKEFGEKGIDLIEKAEDLAFAKKFKF